MLNTGVLGHSPEQYYYSLRAFVDRFRPHAVVVSTFTNDFGGDFEVPTTGTGDWDEGKYWLDRITQLCRSRQWPHLIVPVPYAPNLFGQRKAGYYPGILSNILEVGSLMFVNPAEDFINAHLELAVERGREGDPRARVLCSTRGSAMATSRRWARRSGPARWAVASSCC